MIVYTRRHAQIINKNSTLFAVAVMIALLIMACLSGLNGCTQLAPPGQPLTQLQQGPIVQRVTRDATFAALVAVKSADRVKLAQAVSNIATAISTATASSPDLSSIQAIVRPAVAKEIAKLNSPYGILITAIFTDAADVADESYLQALSTATATDKGKAAQALIQSITAGVKTGADLVIALEMVAATQPG